MYLNIFDRKPTPIIIVPGNNYQVLVLPSDNIAQMSLRYTSNILPKNSSISPMILRQPYPNFPSPHLFILATGVIYPTTNVPSPGQIVARTVCQPDRVQVLQTSRWNQSKQHPYDTRVHRAALSFVSTHLHVSLPKVKRGQAPTFFNPCPTIR